MRIELLKQNLIVNGKFFFGIVADTPKGLNDERTIIWKEISEEEYVNIMSRCEDPNEFKVLHNLTPKGTETKITEIYKK